MLKLDFIKKDDYILEASFVVGERTTVKVGKFSKEYIDRFKSKNTGLWCDIETLSKDGKWRRELSSIYYRSQEEMEFYLNSSEEFKNDVAKSIELSDFYYQKNSESVSFEKL